MACQGIVEDLTHWNDVPGTSVRQKLLHVLRGDRLAWFLVIMLVGVTASAGVYVLLVRSPRNPRNSQMAVVHRARADQAVPTVPFVPTVPTVATVPTAAFPTVVPVQSIMPSASSGPGIQSVPRPIASPPASVLTKILVDMYRRHGSPAVKP